MNEIPKGAALVVGATGGIGEAICASLASTGVDVAVGYRCDAARARALAGELVSHGVAALPVHIDLAVDGSPASAVAEVAAWRPLYTLVYAAGPSIPMQWVSRIDPADLERCLAVDVHGFFGLLSAALPHLRAHAGSVVAVTTAALVRYTSRDALSAVPKAALEALVRAVAKEEGRYGVRANTVAIGVVDAGMFRRLRAAGELGDAWLEASRKNTPLGREATAAEVAAAVTFLTSRDAGFITGHRLVVDGGYSL